MQATSPSTRASRRCGKISRVDFGHAAGSSNTATGASHVRWVRLDLVPAVPEPGACAMLLAGLALFGARRLRASLPPYRAPRTLDPASIAYNSGRFSHRLEAMKLFI
jgi:hypothetical protein